VVAKETGRRKASERGRQGSVEEWLGLGAWGCGSRGAGGVLVGRWGGGGCVHKMT
jgi:hypothetical protein